MTLNRNALKTTALVSMLLDHIGMIIVYPMYINACMVDGVEMMGELVPDEAKRLYMLYTILRIIGRLAFPIFAFMITEGFIHTQNLKKYILRLFLFAAISEIPYNLAAGRSFLYPYSQNVLWTFLIAVIMIWAAEKYALKIENTAKRIIVSVLLVLAAAFLSALSDGGFSGMLLIASMYFFKDDKKKYWLGCAASIIIMSIQFMDIQIFALLALVLIEMYNGEKGKGNKYLFYIFYPAHLLALTLIYLAMGL